MKYQVRIKDIMSDKPASELFDTREEAQQALEEVREEIRETWATPDEDAAYIYLHIGKKYEAQTRYDAKNTVKVTMKLNKTTDQDVLNALAMQASKQGYIKRLIREDLAKKVKCHEMSQDKL